MQLSSILLSLSYLICVAFFCPLLCKILCKVCFLKVLCAAIPVIHDSVTWLIFYYIPVYCDRSKCLPWTVGYKLCQVYIICTNQGGGVKVHTLGNSFPFPMTAYIYQGHGGLEPIPADIEREVGFTSSSQGWHTLTFTNRVTN